MGTSGPSFRPEQLGLFNQGGRDFPVPEPSKEPDPKEPVAEKVQLEEDETGGRYDDLGGYGQGSYRDRKRKGDYKN